MDIAEAKLAETAGLVAAAGGAGARIRADVADEGQVSSAVAEAKRLYGRLDTIVPRAGIAVTGTIPDMDRADWDRALAVNLTGVFHLARHGIPAIDPGRGGAFVVINFDAEMQAAPGFGALGASKHGVIGLVLALALDHGPQGIRCNAVCPGFVETPMTEQIFAALPSGEVVAWRGRCLLATSPGRRRWRQLSHV